MDLRHRWPILDEICLKAEQLGDMEVWAFGSMLRPIDPSDLDILIVYRDRANVELLRSEVLWELSIPPVHIIAMDHDEQRYYRFIEETGALCLHPRPESLLGTVSGFPALDS
jgi:hypothetical protein